MKGACYERGMEPFSCSHCSADLTKTGVREYGAVRFEIKLYWSDEDDCFVMPDDDEPKYGDCTSLDWACPQCGWDLDFDPTEPQDDD